MRPLTHRISTEPHPYQPTILRRIDIVVPKALGDAMPPYFIRATVWAGLEYVGIPQIANFIHKGDEY